MQNWDSVDTPENNYVLLAPSGYLHDFMRGRIQFCAKLCNAALFSAEQAIYMQKRVPGCAILNTDGKLLELSEVFGKIGE